MTRGPAAPPPEHVLSAFGAPAAEPELLSKARPRTWRCASTVLRNVDDPAEASWLAGTLEQMQVNGVRLARPVRSSDGRWVVSGWTAHRFVSGSPAPRHDEIMRTAIAVHTALEPFPEPRFLRDRTDLRSWANLLAWGEAEDQGRIGSGHGARLFLGLAAGRRPVDLPSQVVHGDLARNVLFAGDAPPAVVDFAAFWRPAGWAAALVAVDSLAWGSAPIEFLTDWSQLPDWPQMLRRALLFRLAITLAHPLTLPDELVTVLSTAERIEPYLD